MNFDTAPMYMRDDQCEIIQNYTLDNLGSLTKRKGIAYLIGQTIDGMNILNMYYHFSEILYNGATLDYSTPLVAVNASGGATSVIYKIRVGVSTTQFDITNPSGTTFRYTYDGTGTDPGISATSIINGTGIQISAQNFNSANNGTFTITGIGANYFEITNASGVAENNKTIGTGEIVTWITTQTGNTASAIPVFASFILSTFRVNGKDAMARANNSLSWTTASTDTNCLAVANIPKYICVWQDRVYALNDQKTSSFANPSRIYWSSLPSSSGAITWTPSTDYADINPDDNDEITWGEPFGPVMLIFKEKSIFRWTFGQTESDPVPGTQGTPQGLTVKQTNGICFFANKYGVWALTNAYGIPQLISKKVQSFIDAIPTLANMRAEVDQDHYKLYIGNVTVDNTTYSNCMLVYTISRESWHIETYPFAITAMVRLRRKTIGITEIYDDIYLGDNDGFVYRTNSGNSDNNGTTSVPISGKILTKEYPLPKFPYKSDLKKMWILAKYGVGARINYRLDRTRDGRWETFGDISGRFTEKSIYGKGRTIQLSITDNSTQNSQVDGLLIEDVDEKIKMGRTDD